MSFACACFSPLCTYIPFACQSYVLVCHLYVTCMYLHVMVCVSFVLVFHPYVTRLYSYVISISLVCTRVSSVCHSYVLVYHPYVTHMYSHVIRMSLACTRISSLCHSFVLVCHQYVTRMYSYVIRMSLVCTRMSSVCHSSVVLPWTILIIGFHQLISKCRKWINFFVKTRNENYKSLRDIDKEISIEGASLKFGVPRNTISNWVNKFF